MAAHPRRDDAGYRLSDDDRARFAGDGFVHLRGVLDEDEVAGLEEVYSRFLRREIAVPDKDFCDMSGAYGRAAAEYEIVNVMLPRRYHPPWQGNVLERRAASIAAQLRGDGLVLDYDQLLAKPPQRPGGVFPWHQDLAYWPVTPDTRTATIWLAIDDATLDNGCMRFVPGSHLEERLRPHRPLCGDRGEAHALVAEVDPARDQIVPVPIRRGDATVHHERVLHGSGGNGTAGWRRAYIVAFRARTAVEEERRRGFTHSHNDAPAALGDVGFRGDARRA